jgi:hypothetical protein
MKSFQVRTFCCAAIGVLVCAGARSGLAQSLSGALDVEIKRDPGPAEAATAPGRPQGFESERPTVLPGQPGSAPASSWDTRAAYDPAQTLVPPGVEGEPFASSGGGYCYVGPHPSDTRVTPGTAWDSTEGQHLRPYAPVDLRLFSYRQGCYYFIGDPRDFGYGGQVSNYYGAHPVLASYGGGWCFMMGGHSHVWSPWSPYFTVVGPWYYWRGPYDPFFWTYWPYYSTYYRAYYPHYYGGGRFYRGGGYHVAPAFGRGGFRGPAVRGGLAPPVRGAAGSPPYRGMGAGVAPYSGAGPQRGASAPSVRGAAGPMAPRTFAAPAPMRPSSAGARVMTAPASRSFAPSGGSSHGGGFHVGGARGGRR